jgi:hypothetical protein
LRKFEDTIGVIKSPKNHRTDNTMAKRKITGQTIQWPKEKSQDRQYNGIQKYKQLFPICHKLSNQI